MNTVVENHFWLAPLAEAVARQFGLYFPPDRWADLERGARDAASRLGVADVAHFAHSFVSSSTDSRAVDELVDALTIPETYFFRDTDSFDVLAEKVLSPLIRERERSGMRHLRLWSAGCSTGEEAYTLAILVDRLLPARAQWSIDLLATDISPGRLEAAQRGRYGEWSFRATPPSIKQRYFVPAGARQYAVAPRVRRMVTFSPLNLADAMHPTWARRAASMDLIVCRNVLMYMTAAQAQRALQRVAGALAPGGWLWVSAAEAAAGLAHPLVPICFGDTVLHRGPTPAYAALPQAQPAHAVRRNATSAGSPGSPRTRAADALRMTRVHVAEGQPTLARACIERALSVFKLDPGTHHLHATVLEQVGCLDDARAALRRALFLEPDFVLAHWSLGRISSAQGHHDDAQRHYHHALAALQAGADTDPLPHGDGRTVGQLRAIVEAALTEHATS